LEIQQANPLWTNLIRTMLEFRPRSREFLRRMLDVTDSAAVAALTAAVKAHFSRMEHLCYQFHWSSV
jgi:hypothetical protein